MSVKLDDTLYLHFGTASATTGAATDADTLPVATVEEDGVPLGYSPTVANVATGLYRVTIVCTTANGFEAGKRYSLYVVATVGGITGRDGIAEFVVETNYLDDVYTAVGTRAAPGDSMMLTGGAIAAMWDEVLEGALSAREFMRIIMSGLAGISSDDGKEFWDLAGAKKRIDGTMFLKDRTAVVLDGS